MAREDRDSQYGGGGYKSENNRSDREQRRTEQYTSQATKDLAAGVGYGGIGSLADPREKQDYFGSTIFGPSRKYTGSFLDNILGGGYRAVQPYAPDQFQSRLSQAGGLGKSVFGGILGLINPMAGMLYRVASSVPGGFKRFQSSPTLADYFSGFNFGENKNISDVYANQGRGSGLRNTGIMTMPMQNIDPYKYSIGPRPVTMPQYFDNINTYEEPDFYSNAMAGLTDEQKKLLDQRRGMYPNILGAQEMLDNISSEDDPNDPATIEDIQKYYGVV
jgi:hypothetical protein